jgi:hypothetical protein
MNMGTDTMSFRERVLAYSESVDTDALNVVVELVALQERMTPELFDVLRPEQRQGFRMVGTLLADVLARWDEDLAAGRRPEFTLSDAITMFTASNLMEGWSLSSAQFIALADAADELQKAGFSMEFIPDGEEGTQAGREAGDRPGS